MKNDIRTIIADVDKSRAFKKDLEYYGLTIKDVSIVYQREDERGNVYFDLLRKGKQPLVRIHLVLEKGKMQIDSLYVDAAIRRYTEPQMTEKEIQAIYDMEMAKVRAKKTGKKKILKKVA